MPLPHANIVELIKHLGYPITTEGVCHGFSAMAMQALLSNELDVFEKRLALMTRIMHKSSPAELAKTIENLEERRKRLQKKYKMDMFKKLTPHELELLEVRAFIEGILLYFNASRFPQLFDKNNRPKFQDIETALPKGIPHKLGNVIYPEEKNHFEDKKPLPYEQSLIKKANTLMGLYNLTELTSYFNLLRTELPHTIPPIAFILHNQSHTVTVTYDIQTKSWTLIDIDRLPFIGKAKSDEDIAECILATFSKNDITTFAAEVYCHSNQEEKLQDAFLSLQKNKAWCDMHHISGKENTHDSQGAGLLFTAADCNNATLAKALVESKSDINHAANNGATPIYIASQNGHAGLVAQLIEKKADVNASYKGMTPCYIAAKLGYTDVMKALLQSKKLDVNKSISNNVTPLFIAAQNGHVEVVNLLLQHDDSSLNQPTFDGVTPLLSACDHNHTDIVKVLLECKEIHVNKANKDNMTPIYAAAQKGYSAIIRLLNEKGANANTTTHDGITPLYIAAQNDDLASVQALLENKHIMPDTPIPSRFTPFILAVHNRDTAIAEALLNSNKVDINQKSPNGASAIYLAAEKGDLNMVKLLIDKKADLNAVAPINAKNILSIARENKRESQVKQLLTNKKINFRPLQAAIFFGHTSTVKMLLAAGVPNNDDELEIARAMNRKDIVKLLAPEMKLQQDTGLTMFERWKQNFQRRSKSSRVESKKNKP